MAAVRLLGSQTEKDPRAWPVFFLAVHPHKRIAGQEMGQEHSSPMHNSEVNMRPPPAGAARVPDGSAAEVVKRDEGSAAPMVRPPPSGPKLKAAEVMQDENSPMGAASRPTAKARKNSFVLVGPDGSCEVFGGAGTSAVRAFAPVSTSPGSFHKNDPPSAPSQPAIDPWR